MPSWKRVITSGSDASLNTLTVSNGITGSLEGTSSYSNKSLSSSYAETASYAPNLTISGSITSVNYIDFNTGSAAPAWKSGRVYWNNTDGCLDIYNAEADVTLQVGQENWTRIRNNTGVTIANGAVVRLDGSQGDVPTAVLAQSIAVSGSVNVDNQILGLATHDIEANSFGYVTTQGLVRGVNTNAFIEGETLYVSTTAGLLTGTAPEAPFEIIPVGVCVRSGPGGSGIIYVAVQEPIDFSDLSSVLVQGNYTYGNLWTYVQSGSYGVWTHTNQLSGSYGLTGSLSVTNGGVTGSLFGTASYALEALTSSYAQTASYVNPLTQDVSITGSLYVSSSAKSIFINTLPNDTVTEFVAGGSGVVDFSYLNPGNSVIKIRPQDALIQGQNVSYLTIRGASAKVKIDTDNASNDVELQPTTGNVAIGKTSANSKLDVNGNVIITGSLTVTQGITGSLFGTASWAVSSSHAVDALTSSYSLNSGLLEGSNKAVFITTGSIDTNQTISGSLTITQDLTVIGSSSIQYITSSQLLIADNVISVNTFGPSIRFGGIAVIDSGSSPQTSGSLLFDSQNNQWIYVHQSDGSSAVTSSVLIMGPQTFNNIGNETTITVNKLTKGTGGDLGEHIGDSNITDTGTVVSINSSTQLTGSLVVSQTITGSILNISSTPTLNNTNSQILTRNSTTGQVEYSTQASAYIFNYGIANAFINQNYLT